MSKSLAGKLGIPAVSERAPIAVDTVREIRPGGLPEERPVRVSWPDGRFWAVERVYGRDEYGSPADGNLVVRWRVLMAGLPKILYQEGDSWFVRARH